jgi:uncharacterized protein (DUF2252 family)
MCVYTVPTPRLQQSTRLKSLQGRTNDQSTLSILLMTDTESAGNHDEDGGAMDRINPLLGDEVAPDSSWSGALTVAQRQAAGKALRDATPRSSHAAWTPPSDRPDPIDLLEAQAQTRISELIPIRYGRMLASPFAFLRGAAVVMAHDLASTPVTGLTVQLCGDCHLANFGAYASPERTLVFDINDFDETLPGPWEWDLKRLAASFLVAVRTFGLRPTECRTVVLRLVETYRTQMQAFAQQTRLAVWYARLSVEDVLPRLNAEQRERAQKEIIAKAQTHHHLQAFSKLTALSDGVRRIVADPPVVTPVESAELSQNLRAIVRGYRETLQNDRRYLFEGYRLVDVALKVVGVGSVGTHCYIALLIGRDDDDPLFLQLKQAEASVLEGHLPKSTYRHHGRRVVAGQRLMQASSDIFLGWTRSQTGRDYYVRQLRDWKYSVPLEKLLPQGWLLYAQVCGWTLARAHARSGDRIQLAAYLGGSAHLDETIADFAEAYAEQTERDHAALVAAAESGRIKAQTGV